MQLKNVKRYFIRQGIKFIDQGDSGILKVPSLEGTIVVQADDQDRVFSVKNYGCEYAKGRFASLADVKRALAITVFDYDFEL